MFLKFVSRIIFPWICCLLMAGCFADDEIDHLLDLWDYGDPKATEVLFVSLTEEASLSDNAEYLPILITQLARTHSMRNELSLAHKQLNQAESMVSDEQSRAWVFILLERGRTYNSSGNKPEALRYFEKAFSIAELIGNDYLAVDAAHMVAIAETLVNQMKWNVIALRIAESSDSESARKWLGSLYNNMGWTLFDQGEYDKALALFEKGVIFRREQGNARRLRIARWSVARTYRAVGMVDEALAIQTLLLQESEIQALPFDAYVFEELAELYHIKGDARAPDYFNRAYLLLVQDKWLNRNEPQRVARLKKLATVQPVLEQPIPEQSIPEQSIPERPARDL